MANSIVHFVVYAEKPERARSFYREVFGWDFAMGASPGFYEIRTGPAGDPGVTSGSMLRRPPGHGPGIHGYRCSVWVQDIEATIAAIMANGGTMSAAPIAIPQLGKVAEFTDPEGNLVSIAQFEDAGPPRDGRVNGD